MAACATVGGAFREDSAVPDGKAVVYFYRPRAFSGSALNLLILNKDGPVVSLRNGAYYKYVMTAESIKFWTQTGVVDTPVTVDARAGQIYYVRFKATGFLVPDQQWLVIVDRDTALKEISRCSPNE